MMAAARRSPMKPWSSHEENRLLIWSAMGKSLADFARAVGRRPGGVRLKLMRLRANPALRPPEFTEDQTDAAAASACAASADAPPATDAAAPRVKVACGPADTPEGT